MLGPTLTTALLASAERTANGLLQFDPGSQAHLQQLEGKTLAIHLSQPSLTVAVFCAQGQLQLRGHAEAADAEVSGSLADILAWLNSGESLAQHHLSVRGSTQLLQQWQALASQLDIDWEDMANRYLGDVVGHGVASGARQAFAWGQARGRNVTQQAVEFGVEELQLLPNRALFEDFRQRNQSLRLAADRLAARVQRLKTRLSETSE
ncbi:ubiquinone biosynthesis accessory factor UbiJ [Halioxenophilus aromaticivorans]|uniref:Ubiquinone biosynthesis accessory factor UbiJ n=1 Tax=Halioxenophilus aromaticivorans TaxID=1306992 RepID=A0AAV3U5Q2_9ALTE